MSNHGGRTRTMENSLRARHGGFPRNSHRRSGTQFFDSGFLCVHSTRKLLGKNSDLPLPTEKQNSMADARDLTDQIDQYVFQYYVSAIGAF